MGSGQGNLLVTLHEELKKRVQSKKSQLIGTQKILLEKGFDADLAELLGITPPTDDEIIQYWVGLVLVRLNEEGPIGKDGLFCIEYFTRVYRQNPPYKNSLFSLFSSIVTKEIMNCKTIASQRR